MPRRCTSAELIISAVKEAFFNNTSFLLIEFCHALVPALQTHIALTHFWPKNYEELKNQPATMRHYGAL